MVDVDGMGRAFPELQMVTFTIGGVKSTPMALVDEKGNSCIFETITNKWTEELARSVTMSCGGSVSVSLYPMSGKQMKEFGVRGIVTRSERLGRAIRTVKDSGDQTPEEHFLEMTEGYKLFKGKISDVLRETRAGFNFGKAVLDGIGELFLCHAGFFTGCFDSFSQRYLVHTVVSFRTVSVLKVYGRCGMFHRSI